MDKYQVLKSIFGHTAFRAGQEQLIDGLIDGRDVLGVMPTGAGKSMCYQIPALMLPGVALVVSPLISLMKDQVAALRASGVAAAYMNSSLTSRQLDVALQRAREGAYRIIYVAPERLDTPSFQAFAADAQLSLIAVDEAHCVSQWGQDFRPNYLKIADFVARLPRRVPVGAFTATATQKVSDDIVSLLRLRDPVRTSTGFDRPNLWFEVLRPSKRYGALAAILRTKPFDSGIVYCSTRKNVEDVCEKLQADGFSAARYHAGLSDMERHKAQEDFQFDRVQIMVATNAFGMGIDKSNVRYVIHYNMPKSMEAYYQEAGRAGRDGDEAECILLYSGQDMITGKYLIEHSDPNPDLTAAEQAAVRRQDMRRLQQMADYATGEHCYRQAILRYFGESAPSDCHACSHCAGKRYGVEERVEVPKRRRTEAPVALDQLGVPQIHISAPKPRTAPPNPEMANDGSLFDALRACRMQLAKEAHAPAYIILPDTALHDMEARRPATMAAMSQVKGMGEVKLARYGDAFLTAIRAWKLANPTAPQTSTRKVAQSAADYRASLAPAPKADAFPDAPVPPPQAPEAARKPPLQAAPVLRPWTHEEDSRICRGYLAGISVDQLAALDERTPQEVRDRLRQAGLIL